MLCWNLRQSISSLLNRHTTKPPLWSRSLASFLVSQLPLVIGISDVSSLYTRPKEWDQKEYGLACHGEPIS